MEIPSGSLSRRLISTTAGARLNIQVNVSVNPGSIILTDEGMAGLVDCKMIPQFIVMQLQELLSGYPIIGGDAKSTFEEKEALV